MDAGPSVRHEGCGLGSPRGEYEKLIKCLEVCSIFFFLLQGISRNCDLMTAFSCLTRRARAYFPLHLKERSIGAHGRKARLVLLCSGQAVSGCVRNRVPLAFQRADSEKQPCTLSGDLCVVVVREMTTWPQFP